jgi:hypothetical protein
LDRKADDAPGGPQIGRSHDHYLLEGSDVGRETSGGEGILA